jgi:hypothetical protein
LCGALGGFGDPSLAVHLVLLPFLLACLAFLFTLQHILPSRLLCIRHSLNDVFVAATNYPILAESVAPDFYLPDRTGHVLSFLIESAIHASIPACVKSGRNPVSMEAVG